MGTQWLCGERVDFSVCIIRHTCNIARSGAGSIHLVYDTPYGRATIVVNSPIHRCVARFMCVWLVRHPATEIRADPFRSAVVEYTATNR